MMRAFGLALVCWGTIFALFAFGVGGGIAALTPGGMFFSFLLVLGPTILALPAGRSLHAPLWAGETIVCWGLLGYLLVLVDPAALGHGLAFALLLPALFGALASPGLLVAAWLAPTWAAVIRRQSYLLAALPGGLILLRALEALAPLTAILFGLLLLSAQLLFVSSLRRPLPTAAAPAADPISMPPPSAPISATPTPPIPLRPVIAIATRARLD